MGRGHRRTAAVRALLTIDLNRAVRPLTAGMAATLNVEPAGMFVRSIQRSLDVANSVSRQVLVSGGPLGIVAGRCAR